MNNPVKMSPLRNCVKCELHGHNKKYTGGHVRICPYRLCPCEQCQEHDQLLAALSRERRRRMEMKQKKRGEALLSHVMVRNLRENMENRRVGVGGSMKNIQPAGSDAEGFLSSDTEGFLSDVDDYKDSDGDVDDVDTHIFDDLSGTEASSNTVRGHIFTPPRPVDTPTSPGQCPRASFNNLRRYHDPIFTLPRPLNTLPSPPRSPSPSPPLPTPFTSSHKSQECSPVLFSLGSSASADHSQAGGTMISPQSTEGYSYGYNNSFGVGDIFSRMEDQKVEDISFSEELLNDSMEEFENEYDEFDNKYLTETEDSKQEEVVTSYESDTNNNELINIKGKVDIGSHGLFETKSHSSAFSDTNDTQNDGVVKGVEEIPMKNEDLDIPKVPCTQGSPHVRPVRWDVPPPGLTIEQLLLPLPPIHHVAQIAVPHHLRGLLVGRGGHFVRRIAEESGATVSLAGPVFCTVQGSSHGVEVAIKLIQERLSGYSY